MEENRDPRNRAPFEGKATYTREGITSQQGKGRQSFQLPGSGRLVIYIGEKKKIGPYCTLLKKKLVMILPFPLFYM